MSAVVFFIAAIGAIAGAIGVVALRNPFYSVLALVGHLLSLAALFLLLRAEFIAAAQVVVYAGAVMVLYLFVVSYIGGGSLQQMTPGGSNLRLIAGTAVLALFAELAIAVLGSGLQAIDSDGAPYVSGFGSPAAIGEALLTKFLFPFEVASLLLLVAAVGAVVLARRRTGGTTLDDEARDAAHYITPRSLFSGTMAEAVGAIRDPAEPPVGVTDETERSGW
ncbi:MAG TPA: NADH-quinone oxidoreductase subunit J [Conexibacter sp.]|nr:NADH-quinone oxidoreductase subunit J [Conexibacter sp.]